MSAPTLTFYVGVFYNQAVDWIIAYIFKTYEIYIK